MPAPVSVTKKMVPHLHPRGAICQKDYFNISHLTAQYSSLSSKAYLTDSNMQCYSPCVHKQTDKWNTPQPVCLYLPRSFQVFSRPDTRHQVCLLWSGWSKLTRAVGTFLPVFIKDVTCLKAMGFHSISIDIKVVYIFIYSWTFLAFISLEWGQKVLGTEKRDHEIMEAQL